MTIEDIRKIVREVVSGEFEPAFERGGGAQSEPDQSGVIRGDDMPQAGDTSGMHRQSGTFSEKSPESEHFWFHGGDESRDSSNDDTLLEDEDEDESEED